MKKKINEVLLVEGKYDVNTVLQYYDAVMIKLDGFRIFNDKQKQSFLRKLAEKKTIVILTDSDHAGLKLRNFVKGIIPEGKIRQAYIPQIKGKEKRKNQPGKEGLLGVEGMSVEVLDHALKMAGVTFDDQPAEIQSEKISKSDLMMLGLSGGKDSLEKRKIFLKSLDLPDNLSANALIDALNIFMTRAEFFERCEKMN